MIAHTTAPPASCPRCGPSSRHSHRDYTRRPRALPRWEHAVRLGRRVRRFCCLKASCTPQMFAERVPPWVRPAAPRTGRLPAAVQPLGLALGGEAGVRLGARLHVPTSPDPRLRLVRQLPDPPMAPPAIRGGADWAMRRGRTYGTLLVDLARHRPIDLLPDRTADTRAAWLRAHPGVTILRRARSMEYARGAIQGAPAAHHVLDRWPLVRHLRDALERLLARLQRR